VGSGKVWRHMYADLWRGQMLRMSMIERQNACSMQMFCSQCWAHTVHQ
jgi:hypothetical protein